MNKMFGGMMKGIEFGKVLGNQFALSPLGGVAVNNGKGEYVAYDPATKDLTDIGNFKFDAAQLFFKMPVNVADLREGDIILVDGVPKSVIVAAPVKGTVGVIDPVARKQEIIIIPKKLFGWRMVTKIVSLIDVNMFSAGGEGDMAFNPMLMLLSGDKGEGGFGMKEMLMMQMFAGQGGGAMGGFDMSNPMAMMMLMGDDDGFGGGDGFSDLMMIMMMQGNNPFAPKAPVAATPVPRTVAPTAPTEA